VEFQFFVRILFNVIGGLGVFLLGMKNMSEGMQAVAGRRLRALINAATNNRLTACAVGTAVTALIQSSSVTTVMVVGLVNAGLMTLTQAIGVILGADIGTTITGWILVLRIGKYGLPMLGIAAFFFLFAKNERLRYTAMLVMGLGMVFFGLELMKNGFGPLRELPEFKAWLCKFTPSDYFGVLRCTLVGAAVTAIVQSSSATVGMTMGLAFTGVINFETAAALVLGENIGTTVTAYLASLGASRNAKRTAYAHIMVKVIGVAWITAVFPLYVGAVTDWLGVDPNLASSGPDGTVTFPHIMRGIAFAHTGFNIVNVCVLLPFVSVLAALLHRLWPDKPVKEPPHLTYLDVRMLDTPALGIEQSKKELLNMAYGVRKMLVFFRDVLTTEEIDDQKERKIFHREEILDNIQQEIVVFLSNLLGGSVPHGVMDEARKQLRMADEYESLSDYIVNVLKMHKKLDKNRMRLPEEGMREIIDLHDRVASYIDMVTKAVEEGSVDVISRAHSDGDLITSRMKRYRQEHLTRLANNDVEPLVSVVFADMLNAYRRMKDHALNIAEAVAGEK